jgi:hypothetical protein
MPTTRARASAALGVLIILAACKGQERSWRSPGCRVARAQ